MEIKGIFNKSQMEEKSSHSIQKIFEKCHKSKKIYRDFKNCIQTFYDLLKIFRYN